MTSKKEKAQLKEMIESFYKHAQVPMTWNFEVNEQMAEVFGIMIRETKQCSKAFGWIPTPPGGRASIGWLVMQLGRGVFNHYILQISWTCAMGVINRWGNQLKMASMGLYIGR